MLSHSKFTAGSITVKAPSSLRAYLKLSGKEVVVDADAQVHDMAKDYKGGGMTVTGKQTAVGGWPSRMREWQFAHCSSS